VERKQITGKLANRWCTPLFLAVLCNDHLLLGALCQERVDVGECCTPFRIQFFPSSSNGQRDELREEVFVMDSIACAIHHERQALVRILREVVSGQSMLEDKKSALRYKKSIVWFKDRPGTEIKGREQEEYTLSYLGLAVQRCSLDMFQMISYHCSDVASADGRIGYDVFNFSGNVLAFLVLIWNMRLAGSLLLDESCVPVNRRKSFIVSLTSMLCFRYRFGRKPELCSDSEMFMNALRARGTSYTHTDNYTLRICDFDLLKMGAFPSFDGEKLEVADEFLDSVFGETFRQVRDVQRLILRMVFEDQKQQQIQQVHSASIFETWK
jgi:hypothetical protein